MLTEIQDRDAIFAGAIAIASAEERQAYIAGACGNDVELRRQVESMVAAHFQNASAAKPSHAAVNGASSPHRTPEKAAASPAENHSAPAASPTPFWQALRQNPRLATSLVILQLLLLAAAAGGAALGIWGIHKEEKASKDRDEAVAQRSQAEKDAEQAKHQREESETARQAIEKERDEAVKAEKTAQDSVEDTKLVLAFINDKLLSVARPKGLTGGPEGWPGGLGKDVTLRQAVDSAASKVAETFKDRPLAEASIRETLGATYVDLEEPKLAVKQYERALALREGLQGTNHPATVTCRNKLAVAYRLAGRTDDASRLYDRNLKAPEGERSRNRG